MTYSYARAVKTVFLFLTLSVVWLHAAPAEGTGKNPKGQAGATKTEKSSAKKEEPPPKIEGMEIARGGNGFLGLQIVEGRFKLSFYDAKKKAIAPDVARAALRWPVNYKIGDERTVLMPDGNKALTSTKAVRPPYTFKLFITLIREGDQAAADSPAGETYVIDFRQ